MHYRVTFYLGVGAFFILIIWFSVGFFLPLMFNDFQKSGQFGDGFGVVNSLFAGLGALGLIFTISSQVETARNQQQLDKFNLSLKLVDDIKSDLQHITFTVPSGSYTGLVAIDKLKELLATKTYIEYSENFTGLRFSSLFTYLVAVVHQIKGILEYNEKHLKRMEESKILKDKLTLMFVTFLLPLSDIMKNKEYEDGMIDLLKTAIDELKVKLLVDLI
jgi:hypothetical protein